MYESTKKSRGPIKKRRIVSPMAWGNGAYVVHQYLERYLKEYRVIGYHPYLTLIPFVLPAAFPLKSSDLIHTTPDYAVYFYRKSTPLVLSFQNYVLDRWMRQFSSWGQWAHYATNLRMWTKLALQKAHTITAVSYHTARLIRQDLRILEFIKVIYNGVDIDHFTPRRPPMSEQKEVRVFFSGNTTRRKGANWLPSIAKQLQKNVRIYYTKGLRTQTGLASHPKLKSVGFVSFKEMPNRYREMDILVAPTVREGFSLAVLEAMACELPVVASDCSSLPEQIDDGNGGFLCPVGDVNAFAEKINLLADSPNLRREMGEYNRAKVEKMFSLDRMVKEYQELFDEVLG